jgi:hypothetical protein
MRPFFKKLIEYPEIPSYTVQGPTTKEKKRQLFHDRYLLEVEVEVEVVVAAAAAAAKQSIFFITFEGQHTFAKWLLTPTKKSAESCYSKIYAINLRKC